MGEVNRKWEFDPESVGKNDLKRYNISTPQEYGEFLRFANSMVNPTRNIPDYYRGHVKMMNEVWRMNIDPSTLSDEQIYEIDQHLVSAYFAQQPLAALLAKYGSTRAMGTPRWQSKHYTVESEKFPAFTAGTATAFRNADSFKLGVEPTWTEGVGAAVKIDLNFTLLAEGREGVYDPEFWHNKLAAEKFGVFWDQRLALGTAGENTSGDLGIKGIHNYTSLQTFATGAGADNNVTAAGDIDFSFVVGLADLMGYENPGYNVVISTSGPATEVLMHDSSGTDRTEYERLQKKWFSSGIISEWVVDNNIEANTNATTTGRMEILRLGPDCVMRELIYPFQKKPNMNTEFQDDVAFTYLVADIYKMYNANLGTICSGDIESSSAGIITNGVFMTGESPPGGKPQAATAIRPTFYPTQGL